MSDLVRAFSLVAFTIAAVLLALSPLLLTGIPQMWFAYHPVSICIGVCP
jgi:heme/copper-type cytochrome/quinol oxidase subunit 1